MAPAGKAGIYMVVITAANEKGGVCKTTSVVLLARGLAKRGKRVLVIDLDPQRGNVSRALGGQSEGYAGSYELLCERKDFTLEDCIQSVGEGVGLVAARPAVEKFATTYEQMMKEQNVMRALVGAEKDWDYVLIDTPPKIAALSLAAMMASDYVLVPTTPTQASVEGLSAVCRTVSQVQEYNERLSVLCVAPMMVDARPSNVQKAMLEITEKLADALEVPVLYVTVPRAKVVQECIDYRRDWTEIEPDEGRNKAVARCWEFVDAFDRAVAGAQAAKARRAAAEAGRR